MHLFSYHFVWVFCCRSTCSHIVCSVVFRSISFHVVFSEHLDLFSYSFFYGVPVVMSFFLVFFSEHRFSYRFCLLFSRNTCSHINSSVLVQSTCFHIICSSVCDSEPLFSYRFCSGGGGGGGVGAFVLISFLTGLFRSIGSTFIKMVLILAWCFLDHVFPGNRFVSSSLLFVEPRVLILEIRIIFSRGGGGGVSEHVFLGYMFVSLSMVLSENVLSYWKHVSF